MSLSLFTCGDPISNRRGRSQERVHGHDEGEERSSREVKRDGEEKERPGVKETLVGVGKQDKDKRTVSLLAFPRTYM